MYKFYFDDKILPVTPGKLTTKIKNQNKTINLINDGEMNILKVPGLTEYRFKFMLPKTNYPFCNPSKASMLEGLYPGFHTMFPLANISGLFPTQEEWLKRIAEYKLNKTPFQFKVIRCKPGLTIRNISIDTNNKGAISYVTFNTNVKCTIEDYTIEEEWKEQMDVWVDIKLKIYIEHKTHTYTKKKDADGVERFHRDDETRDSDVNEKGETKSESQLEQFTKMLGW